MSTEAIFFQMSPSALMSLARSLKWEAYFASDLTSSLSSLPENQQKSWLDGHRSELEQHFTWVGTPIFDFAQGKRNTYREILKSTASKVDVTFQQSDPTEKIEGLLIGKIWRDALSKMDEDTALNIMKKAEALAAEHGASISDSAVGFAALSVAQLSGFGVYLLGSTILGTLNGALGLGLSFGAFTGLSSLISIAIGPIGWIGLGLYTGEEIGRHQLQKITPKHHHNRRRASTYKFSELRLGSRDHKIGWGACEHNSNGDQ